MIKTLIVDDDFLVRMFLKQLIDWQAQGFELIGDACSGIEALELIEQCPVQLIITDLSMPGMDGIELIERVRELLPHCFIIVLSCHGEFEYVKEAMKRGANEYVLKNLLDAPGLCKQLEAARSKLESAEKSAVRTDKLHQLAKKGAEMLRVELAHSLLHGQMMHKDELLQRMQEAGISGSFTNCAAIAVSAETLRRGALAQVCTQFCRGKPVFCLPQDEGCCYLLLNLSLVDSLAAQRGWAKTFATGLYACLEEYLNVSAGLGVSEAFSCVEDLPKAVRSAHNAMTYHFYERRVFDASDLLDAPKELPEQAVALMRRLPTMVDEGLFERVYEDGLQILALCRRQMAPAQDVRRWFTDLLATTGVDGTAPMDYDACVAKLKEITQQLAQERGMGGGSSAIKQAAAYLRTNFSKPVSLANVAAEVHLNPAYLSYLFKREMGINFSDYLMECRMEHMKQLLRKSGAPLKECAAQVGFFDYRNFCKLFKKQTGLRPAQYRSLNRE